MAGANLPMWMGIGHFIMRAPRRMGRTALPAFLARLADQPRSGGEARRVQRIMRRWLRVPGLRSRDTCYLRSLVLFRFLDPRGGELCLHFGVDEPSGAPGDRLHGHAWVSLDGRPLNPPQTLADGRIHEIYRFSSLTRGADASASAAAIAAAMMSANAAAPAPAQPLPV